MPIYNVNRWVDWRLERVLSKLISRYSRLAVTGGTPCYHTSSVYTGGGQFYFILQVDMNSQTRTKGE